MKSSIIFVLISVVIVTIISHAWFSEGKMLSNGSEESLDLFSSQKLAEVTSSFWFPNGTGLKMTLSMPSYPTFFLLAQLSQLGLQPFLIQATFMGFIMILGLIFMYLFLLFILKLPPLFAALGSWFYLLNLYSMSSIWKRLLYNHYIVWAYLPLFLLSWVKWVESGKIRWLILFLSGALIFSYTFAHPAFILTFWITAAIFVLYMLWIFRKDRPRILRIILCSVLGLLLWLTTNIWWTYPFFTNQGSYIENNAPSGQLNLLNLIGVSTFQGTKDIVLLRQSWVFNKEHEWYQFYSNPFIYLLSIMILAILVFGVIKSKKVLRYRWFMVVLLILGWFISKGSNPPLGKIFYTFLFSVFPQTAALRNPYEKFGPVYLLAYSSLFIYGLLWLTKKIKSKMGKVLFLGISLFLFYGILVHPMWDGQVFLSKERVTVPGYYAEANNYLNSIGSKRFFNIPFDLTGTPIEYDWGYSGGDPSSHIFDSGATSVPGIPIYDDLYQKMPIVLEQKNFPRILGMLGVDSLMLHTEITSPRTDVASMSATINNWEGVGPGKKIGKLVIYALDKSLSKPEIYPVGSVVKVYSLDTGIKAILDGTIDLDKSVFVLNPVMNEKLGSLPKINFSKFSNTSYNVNMIDVLNPFVLVLNETFDPSWQLRIDGTIIDEHFKVNGFANGWLVAKTGNYSAKINLHIWPWQ